MAARGHVRALIPQGKPDTAGGCVRASGRALLAPRARSAPLAVRCPRRRLSRAATGIKRNRRRSGRRAARCARAPLRRGLPFLRVARPAGRASRGGSPSAALRRFAPPPPLRGARGSSARRSCPARWAGLARPRRPRPLARVALLPAAALVAALRGRSSSAGPPRAPSRCSRRLSGRRGGFGALRSGGRGRARPAAASPRLRPRPLWPVSRCVRSLAALWRGGALPHIPPAPCPRWGPRGARGFQPCARRSALASAAAGTKEKHTRPLVRSACVRPL